MSLDELNQKLKGKSLEGSRPAFSFLPTRDTGPETQDDAVNTWPSLT